MGQPFIEIVVQGITRIFNCREKGNTSDIPNVTTPNNDIAIN
jgi:hypothetical protein